MDEQKKQYEPYSHPRWNDTSAPEVIGHRELTEEEKKRAAEWRKRIIEREANKSK